MNENYEALGRYTKATETLDGALRERNRQLSELKRLCARVVDNAAGWEAPLDFDFKAARQCLQQAESAHANAVTAVADANSSAIQAQKPAYQWR